MKFPDRLTYLNVDLPHTTSTLGYIYAAAVMGIYHHVKYFGLKNNWRTILIACFRSPTCSSGLGRAVERSESVLKAVQCQISLCLEEMARICRDRHLVLELRLAWDFGRGAQDVSKSSALLDRDGRVA